MSDISKKSFDEILELLRQKAQETYADKSWAGLQEFSLDDLLIKLVAESSQLNGQYLDLRAKNAYLKTSDVYRDIRNLAKNVGHTIQERTSASCTISLTSDGTTLTIPLGTQFATEGGVRFSLTSEVSLNSGNSYTATATVVHAEHSRKELRASGNIKEVLFLNSQDVCVEDLQVRVNGTVWARATDLGDAVSTSQIYLVEFDDFGNAYLVFGDGTYGQRLPADASVNIDVFSGGGPSGNGIAVGEITSLVDAFENSTNLTTISNTSISSGGKARDSIENIVASIPAKQRQVAGYINREDTPKALKRDLSWLQDASIERSFNSVSGVAIPTAVITALPYSSDVVDMSAPQQSELNTKLTNKGEL